MPKFSICLIAKDEAKVLPRLLKSLEDFKAKGGEVVCVDTGSIDNTLQIAKEWGCKVETKGFSHLIDDQRVVEINEKFLVRGEDLIVHPLATYFDFSAARNHAASLASNDMVCFVDADEVLTLNVEEIDKLIDAGNEQFEYNFVFAHDQYGKPAIEFVQSKFYDRRKAKWLGLVHEYLDGDAKKAFLNNDIFRLEHYQEPHARHSYLVGLAVDCFNDPKNDRNSHYFARELFWSKRPKSAIKEFEHHLTMGGWYSERAESLIFIGDAWGQLNNPAEQAATYADAIYVDAQRREPWMKLAEFYLHNKNYQAALGYAKAAMEIPWSGFYATNKAYYEHLPHEICYICYGWLGDIPKAQFHITEALKFQPQNPKYLRDMEYYFGPKDPTDYVDKGIEGWMTPKDLKWLHKIAKEGDTFVEVGSWAGRSSDAILSGKASKVFCVDTWQGSKDVQDLTNGMAKERDMLEVFKKNVGHYPHLNIVHKSSVEAAKDFEDKSIDICFIDAGHTYEEVLQDIDAWLPKVKDDGILCGHDYLPNTWMGVVKAVNERFGKPDQVVDWIWVIDFAARGGVEVARRSHNPLYAGAIPAPATIPKKIWTAWFGDPMPEVVRKSIESQDIPGYEHFVLDEKAVREMRYIPQYIITALDHKKWVKAKDYLLAWVLYTYGGIFLDADQEILPGKNFDDLLNLQLFAAREENMFVANSLVGSRQGHPLWEEYFKQVHANFTPIDDKAFESSMQLFTPLMYDRTDTTVLTPDYFFPYNWQTGIINVTANTRTFHHFMKTWKPNEVDKLPKVSFIIPTLGREEGLKRCLDSIDRLYWPKQLVEILIEQGEDTVPVKVHRAYEKATGEVLVYAANDVEFEPYSLYKAFRCGLDNNKALVAFNVGKVYEDEGNINSHFLITRELADHFGGIFDTDFHHVGVDNFLWARAKAINQAIRCEEAYVTHHHFSEGEPMDWVYERGWKNAEQDRVLLKEKLKILYGTIN